MSDVNSTPTQYAVRLLVKSTGNEHVARFDSALSRELFIFTTDKYATVLATWEDLGDAREAVA